MPLSDESAGSVLGDPTTARPVGEEDHPVLLSALQHVLYCPRQCALIHVEREWAENVHTVEGKLLHERADSGVNERRGDLRVETGLLLYSRQLGLTGKADVVEFHRKGERWIPFPVEYKRGRPKRTDADRVQLCAQALCLEEMTGETVPEGALFYGKTRRREAVAFTDELRRSVRDAAMRVHNLMTDDTLPPPLDNKEPCRACSLREICLPDLGRKHAGTYLASLCEDV